MNGEEKFEIAKKAFEVIRKNIPQCEASEEQMQYCLQTSCIVAAMTMDNVIQFIRDSARTEDGLPDHIKEALYNLALKHADNAKSMIMSVATEEIESN